MNNKPAHFSIEAHAVNQTHRAIKRRLDSSKLRAHRHERRKLREQLRHTEQFVNDDTSID